MSIFGRCKESREFVGELHFLCKRLTVELEKTAKSRSLVEIKEAELDDLILLKLEALEIHVKRLKMLRFKFYGH